MSRNFKFTFISEGTQQLISVEDFDVYSNLLTYNKYLEMKLPGGGRARLKRSFHRDLIIDLRNKVRQAFDRGETTYNIDDMYLKVLKDNNNKYFFGKGKVIMSEGSNYVKRIYSTGTRFFYKDQDKNKWVALEVTNTPNEYLFVGEEDGE